MPATRIPLTIWDKVNIGLLTLALIMLAVVGGLYAFVKGKSGPEGPKGDTGSQGAPQPTIVGSVLQPNVTNFTATNHVNQYSNTITINSFGGCMGLIIGTVYSFGILSNNITKPQAPVFGIVFLDAIYPVPVTMDTSGVISIGPVPHVANNFTLTMVYSI